MNRRGFLSLFSAGVAGIALDQAIPFNRVWSFPSKIMVPEYEGFKVGDVFSIESVNLLNDGVIGRCFGFDYLEEEFDKPFKIGTTIRVRLPQRFIVRDYIGDFSKPKQYEDVTILGDGKISIP